MVSIQQGLRGRTVYGNGSYAPTRGPVSAAGAQGYLKREIDKKTNQVTAGPYNRQPIGGDGKSDRRSGVAANMINKASGFGTKPNKGNTVRPGGSGPRAAAKNTKTTVTKTPAPVAPAPAPPQVTIGPTGTLSLPVGQQFSDEVLAALGDYNASLLDIQQNEQQANMDYQTGLQQQQAGYSAQQRNTLNDSAARGVVTSSGYSQAVGRDAADNQQALNALEFNHNAAINGAGSQRTNIQTMFNNLLQNSARANAETLLPTAANLAPAAKPKPKPSPKPKPKEPKPKAVVNNKKKK